jgi:hypothetical protein
MVSGWQALEGLLALIWNKLKDDYKQTGAGIGKMLYGMSCSSLISLKYSMLKRTKTRPRNTIETNAVA